MSDVDGYSAEWPNKNARVNARHAVTPLEGMPVIWLAGGEERHTHGNTPSQSFHTVKQ